MSAAVKQVRRIKVIDGRLQYRMIAISLSVVVGGLLVFAGLTALYYALAHAEGRAPSLELLRVVLPPLLINDLAIMVLIIVVGIFATHRIAGPAYRIEMDIERALDGERGVRIRLRRNDAFEDLAEKVNQLIERVDNQRTD